MRFSDLKIFNSIVTDLYVKNRIIELVQEGTVRISEHGYDELSHDKLTVKELVNGIEEAKIVEEYPDYPKGGLY